MMRYVKCMLLALWVLTVAPGGPTAAGFTGASASREDAVAMAEDAVRHIAEVGPGQAFRDFQNKADPRWNDRDLYVVVIDDNSVVMAHGLSPSLVGRPTWVMRDVDGKAFVQAILALQAPGWVYFKYRHPFADAIALKALYVIPAGNYRVTVGAYVADD